MGTEFFFFFFLSFILKHKEQNTTREKEREHIGTRLSHSARMTSSQVNIPHICRGARLVQFILRLGSIALVLAELLQAIQQHHLNLLLAGLEAILEGERSRPESC